MIILVKRAAAISSGILLATLLYKHPVLAVACVTFNFAWGVNEKIPLFLRPLVEPLVLAINTVLSAYGIRAGAPPVFALLVAATSLLAWNVELFLQRWEKAPLTVQRRYLKQLGVIIAIGLGAGLSALTLQGHISLSLFSAFLLMLGAGFLWLRIISKTLKKGAPVK